MSSTPHRGSRRLTRGLTAAAAGLALAFGGIVAAPAATAAAADLPSVIPSIDGWEQSSGVFTVPDDLRITYESESLASVADITADELATIYAGADAVAGATGNITLSIDDSRDDLGAEGYDLTVGEQITVTAATRTGVFYGTRTLTQMLTQQATIPQGSLVDVPEYEERGVTLCACVINISPDWIDRLIEEMSYLKLNTLMVEMKLKVDAYPETNTWSYYTKDDVAALVEKAERYGIDVIPEINSPGHMEIWLENLPELQLTNEQTGEKDEVRMDITKDASFDFYTDLIDEYSQVFTSDYWHMGVDEYMLGSGYSNYPQILEFAHENFGADATENDVVAWYVNKVNDYVKSKGKTLRIWNDGVMTDNKAVDFDTDIVVEHWNQAGSSVTPQQFINWGHDIVNVSNALYMVRGGYGVNSANLYNSDWTPEEFYGSTVTEGTDKIRGARLSMWPDAGTPNEAENTTEDRMFEALRFVAQSTWSASTPWDTYDGFSAAMDEIGRPPLWNNAERLPVDDGSYTIAAADGAGALTPGDGGSVALSDSGSPLTLTHTDDGYYSITSSDGRCLDVSREGTMRLDVPVEIGADIALSTCSDTTIQKWQLKRVDGGFTIVNAASQQHLSISDELIDVPVSHEEPKTVADGRIVQTPADWGQTVWTVDGAVAMVASLSSNSAAPGESLNATITVTNSSDTGVTGAEIRIADAAEGWTAFSDSAEIGDVAPLSTANSEFTLYNATGAGGAGTFAFELVDAEGAVVASASVMVNSLCATETMQPTAVSDVSSEQLSGEPAPNGPADAAIDGDAATYWHSQWSAPEAQYPHEIVIDLGESTEVCGAWYTARSGGGSGSANGRIADYEVYGSESTSTIDGEWGEPLTTGTFANISEPQLAEFEPQSIRYIKLVATSEVNGNPWATIAELTAAGPAAAAPTYDASLSLGADSAAPSDEVSATGAGFAPGESVVVDMATPSAERVSASAASDSVVTATADVNGSVSVTFTVPEDSAEGEYSITATGAVTGASASASLVVAAADGGGGDGDGDAPGTDEGDGPGSDDDGSAAPSDPDDSDAGSVLPVTGADILGTLLASLAALIAGGALLYGARRATLRSAKK